MFGNSLSWRGYRCSFCGLTQVAGWQDLLRSVCDFKQLPYRNLKRSYGSASEHPRYPYHQKCWNSIHMFVAVRVSFRFLQHSWFIASEKGCLVKAGSLTAVVQTMLKNNLNSQFPSRTLLFMRPNPLGSNATPMLMEKMNFADPVWLKK